MVKVFVSFFFYDLNVFWLPFIASVPPSCRGGGGREIMGEDAGGEGLASSGHRLAPAAG